jgi:hypothetical protein
MTNHLFIATSKNFQEDMIELLILHLVNCNSADTETDITAPLQIQKIIGLNAKSICPILGKEYGIWRTERQIAAILNRLQRQGMLGWVNFGNNAKITVHGKEEIDDRVTVMKQFINYVNPQNTPIQ